MKSRELESIFEQLREKKKMYLPEPATEEQISDFEREHSISLPAKYREWLLLCDGGELYLPAGIQFYGVAHKPVIDVDDDDRPDESYIVIGTLASGDPIVFEKDKESISVYNHEDDRIEEDETYEDFYAFLDDLNNILGIGG
ncbi:SMI1/KNR4 family protein [Oscillibacter valericigenes]|uniref:SMI1/KNR4 family protein n=1 Tax=Oscillibacter valericigenes TaxID=351091 RepID=UPI001F348E9B|nr:SMI1/KNR4 family protein [Oscillibacter valericigenes]MCF2617309.1 SMI1/KNR4 family protein [Oscillibacter valericigenes]